MSGSEDKTVRLWDAQTGKAIGQPLVGHTDVVNSVAISADGRITVSGDNNITVWQTSPERWLDIACNQLQAHSILLNPTTDVAREASSTCKRYVWSSEKDASKL